MYVKPAHAGARAADAGLGTATMRRLETVDDSRGTSARDVASAAIGLIQLKCECVHLTTRAGLAAGMISAPSAS